MSDVIVLRVPERHNGMVADTRHVRDAAVELFRALLAVEFVEVREDGAVRRECPYCGGARHSEDCRVGNALKAARGGKLESR